MDMRIGVLGTGPAGRAIGAELPGLRVVRPRS